MEKVIKKLKKVIKIISILLIILSMSVVFCEFEDKSNADAGYHSSYSGGSHSRSSSHSSSSSRKSSSSSSSSRSSSSSSDGIVAVISFISFFAFAVVIIIISTKNNTKNRKTITRNNSIAVMNNPRAIEEIKKYIPNFNPQEFLSNGYNIFVRIEEAWMNFELEKVRDVITDEMFNMYQSQLTSMEMKGEQNIMKDFKLLNCAIMQAVKQNGILEVKTRYVIEFYDYIINKDTKQVVRGNSNRKIRMYYEFTFIENVEKEKLEKCPNCGAPINISSAGICEYCNSKLVDDSTSWIMSKKISFDQE